MNRAELTEFVQRACEGGFFDDVWRAWYASLVNSDEERRAWLAFRDRYEELVEGNHDHEVVEFSTARLGGHRVLIHASCFEKVLTQRGYSE